MEVRLDYVCNFGKVGGHIDSGWCVRQSVHLSHFFTTVSCNYVVSVIRGFLFLLVLGIGCVILLCHSLGLSINYFEYSLKVHY